MIHLTLKTYASFGHPWAMFYLLEILQMILYFIVVRMTREMRRIDILSIFAYIFCIHIPHTHIYIYIYTLKHTHVMNCIAESDCEIISYHISQYHMCTVCIYICVNLLWFGCCTVPLFYFTISSFRI